MPLLFIFLVFLPVYINPAGLALTVGTLHRVEVCSGWKLIAAVGLAKPLVCIVGPAVNLLAVSVKDTQLGYIKATQIESVIFQVTVW